LTDAVAAVVVCVLCGCCSGEQVVASHAAPRAIAGLNKMVNRCVTCHYHAGRSQSVWHLYLCVFCRYHDSAAADLVQSLTLSLPRFWNGMVNGQSQKVSKTLLAH